MKERFIVTKDAAEHGIPYLDLYRRMCLIRRVDEAIAAKYPEQRMRCPVHLSIGQEAVSAGAAAALLPSDALFGTHRSHGPYLAMGGDVKAMLAEIFGRAAGCCGGRGGSMHLLDPDCGFWGAVPIVGSTIPIATGAALAFRMRGETRAAMIILGEGASEEGVFHESLQFAALRKLPIAYVCENNGYAVNTPLAERRPSQVAIRELARAHGVATCSGDGNDVVAVHIAYREAVERARSGGGATFLEFETYRWLEHCGPSDDHRPGGRNPDDGEKWRARCPIQSLRNQLVNLRLAGETELADLEEEVADCVRHALIEAEKAPFPAAAGADRGAYAPPAAFVGGEAENA